MKKQVKTPITVEGYVSVSDLVHNVKSGDYINASVISAGEAENNIMVEQIASMMNYDDFEKELDRKLMRLKDNKLRG